MYYFYDGSFLGFLSLIYVVFLNKNFDVFILKQNKNTLFQGVYIETSLAYANQVYSKIEKTLGKEILEKLYGAFLSEEEGIELTIINYIKNGLKIGKEIEKHYLPEVYKIDKLSKKVFHEAHKFKGLLRFRKLQDNSYFGIIKPDYDVLPLIKEHFVDRFNDQNFAIYDELRKKALLFDSISKQTQIVKVDEFDLRLKDLKNNELLHKEELQYMYLWKKYFDSIAIEDRTNPELQKKHMTKKYWDNLIETNI